MLSFLQFPAYQRCTFRDHFIYRRLKAQHPKPIVNENKTKKITKAKSSLPQPRRRKPQQPLGHHHPSFSRSTAQLNWDRTSRRHRGREKRVRYIWIPKYLREKDAAAMLCLLLLLLLWRHSSSQKPASLSGSISADLYQTSYLAWMARYNRIRVYVTLINLVEDTIVPSYTGSS